MKLKQNKQYQATVNLGPAESWAPNVMVAGKFSGAGFTNVKSDGSGSKRTVTGTWPRATQDVDMKQFPQVSNIKELK